LWGASWPAGKLLGQALPPLTAAAMRFAIACIALVAWCIARHGKLPALNFKQSLGMLAGGVFGVYGYAVFFMLGLQMVPASRASLIVTINPVFTTLAAACLFKERFSWPIAVGMGAAVLGAVVVLTRGAPWLLFNGALGVGEWLLLGCVMCWVVYSLIGRALLAGIDALVATTYTALIGLALLVPTALVIDGSAPWQAVPSAETLVVLCFIALGATVLAYAWYFDGIAKLGAGTAASYISLVPVFGVASSTLWLREPIDASLLVGGALAIAGVVWMNQARKRLSPAINKEP
jgi:drug/metabolite transporter (DMT)-like permease